MESVRRLPAAVKVAVLAGAALALVVIGRSTDPGMPPIKHVAITGIGGGYFPISPTRVLDTRTGTPIGRLAANTSTAFTIPTTAVPSGAGSVVLNVTAVNPDTDGFLSIVPGTVTGTPTSSNLNFHAAEVIPNLVIVSLPASGQIRLYANTSVDVVIDVAGYFSPASGTTSGPS